MERKSLRDKRENVIFVLHFEVQDEKDKSGKSWNKIRFLKLKVSPSLSGHESTLHSKWQTVEKQICKFCQKICFSSETVRPCNRNSAKT
jgi:hypothetical protein